MQTMGIIPRYPTPGLLLVLWIHIVNPNPRRSPSLPEMACMNHPQSGSLWVDHPFWGESLEEWHVKPGVAPEALCMLMGNFGIYSTITVVNGAYVGLPTYLGLNFCSCFFPFFHGGQAYAAYAAQAAAAAAAAAQAQQAQAAGAAQRGREWDEINGGPFGIFDLIPQL